MVLSFFVSVYLVSDIQILSIPEYMYKPRFRLMIVRKFLRLNKGSGYRDYL